MHIHLFEWEDFSWFPDVIRTGGTDYLRYFLVAGEVYKPAIPLLEEVLEKQRENNTIDLCAGGGGYIEPVYDELNRGSAEKISIILTDKFPNIKAFLFLKEKTRGGIDYYPGAVDAAHVPGELRGVRTIFSAIHHFKPDQVKSIIQDAVDHRAAIAIFDGGEKNIFAILGLLIIHPIAFLLCTPFFKPFKISRLFFTYILPLIPLYTIWDGIVSILRLYPPGALQKIAETVDREQYVWKSGKKRNRFGIRITYLIGYPSQELFGKQESEAVKK